MADETHKKYVAAFAKYQDGEQKKKAALDAEVAQLKLDAVDGWTAVAGALEKKYHRNVGARRRRFDLAWAEDIELYQKLKEAEKHSEHTEPSDAESAESDESYVPPSHASCQSDYYSSPSPSPEPDTELRTIVTKMGEEVASLKLQMDKLVMDFSGNLIKI